MQGRADMKLMAMRLMVTDIPFLHTSIAWDVQNALLRSVLLGKQRQQLLCI